MERIIFEKPDINKLKKDFTLVDMHFHTDYSIDSFNNKKDSLEICKKLGIGLAITDHNEIKGAEKAIKNNKNMLIIPGMEITSIEGIHTIFYFYNIEEATLFYNKVIKKNKIKDFFVWINMRFDELITSAKDFNCVVCIPHPFATGWTGLSNNIKIDKKTLKKIDIIEIINSYNSRKSNLLAVEWANKTNKAISGGSDGHFLNALGTTLTCNESNDLDNFMKLIIKNKSKVVGIEDGLYKRITNTVKKEYKVIKNTDKNLKMSHLIHEIKSLRNIRMKDCFGNKRINFKSPGFFSH